MYCLIYSEDNLDNLSYLRTRRKKSYSTRKIVNIKKLQFVRGVSTRTQLVKVHGGSIYISIYLYICIYISIYLYICIYISIYLSIYIYKRDFFPCPQILHLNFYCVKQINYIFSCVYCNRSQNLLQYTWHTEKCNLFANFIYIYIRSVLRRQSGDTNRNTKRSVYCQYG